MSRAIAKRLGRPAYENAPPRMRQSQIARPFVPEPIEERSLLSRLMGFGR